MEWGDPKTQKWFKKRAERRGEPIPEHVTPPDIYEDLLLIVTAFLDLSGSRNFGPTGPLYIPVTEILAWLEVHNLADTIERREILMLVQTMDREWVRLQGKKKS